MNENILCKILGKDPFRFSIQLDESKALIKRIKSLVGFDLIEFKMFLNPKELDVPTIATLVDKEANKPKSLDEINLENEAQLNPNSIWNLVPTIRKLMDHLLLSLSLSLSLCV